MNLVYSLNSIDVHILGDNMKGLIKIGLTSKTCKVREKTINKTGQKSPKDNFNEENVLNRFIKNIGLTVKI